MKKLPVISFILVAFFVVFATKNIIPNICLNMGKSAYGVNDYKTAYKFLKVANFLKPKGKNCRYYFVQTLIKMPPTLNVQKDLFNLSQENLPDTADFLADTQVDKWRQQIFEQSGENYIEQTPLNSKILRWDASKFPLRVIILNDSNTTLPDYYVKSIEKAFLQWQDATEKFIRFKSVDRIKNAQIVVKIEPIKENNCTEADCKYVIATTTPVLSGDLLEKMEITFYDLNNEKKFYSQREIYNTALHEIGHALGIMGHSYNKDDLMYMSTKPDSTFDRFRSDFQSITSIDINTLELLYKLIPDITNTDLASYDSSRQFFAPIILGSIEQINSRKMLEAQNYIKNAPNLPNGYIDLASAYAEQNEYHNAIKALDQALVLSLNDSEKFMVYYNFSVVYLNIKNWDKALEYADMAKSIQPDADVDGLLAMINYSKGEKQLAKKLYIESLEKNPKNSIDAINLARIYLQEFNFAEAGKTLNRLVEANPQASENPAVKNFGLLMFFFK